MNPKLAALLFIASFSGLSENVQAGRYPRRHKHSSLSSSPKAASHTPTQDPGEELLEKLDEFNRQEGKRFESIMNSKDDAFIAWAISQLEQEILDFESTLTMLRGHDQADELFRRSPEYAYHWHCRSCQVGRLAYIKKKNKLPVEFREYTNEFGIQVREVVDNAFLEAFPEPLEPL